MRNEGTISGNSIPKMLLAGWLLVSTEHLRKPGKVAIMWRQVPWYMVPFFGVGGLQGISEVFLLITFFGFIDYPVGDKKINDSKTLERGGQQSIPATL